jgi:tetratricopeptide (TPR) repeat protein
MKIIKWIEKIKSTFLLRSLILLATALLLPSCMSVPYYVENGNLEKADMLCEEASLDKKKEFLQILGEAYEENGQLREALEKYKSLAMIYYNEEDYIGSARFFYKLDEIDPKAADGLYKTATSLWNNRYYADSAKYFIKACDKGIENLLQNMEEQEEFFFLKAFTTEQKKETFEVIAEMYLARSQENIAAEYFGALGYIYAAEEEYETAARYFLHTKIPCGNFGRYEVAVSIRTTADRLWNDGEYAEAMKYYEHCTDDPQEIHAFSREHKQISSGVMTGEDYIKLARYFVEIDDWMRSIKYAQLAARMNAWNPGDIETIAEMYSAQDNKLAAAEWFYLGEIKTGTAFEAYRAAISWADRWERYYNAGTSYQNMGNWFLYLRNPDYDDAVYYYQKATEMYKQSEKTDAVISSLFLTSLVYINQLRYDDARPYVRELAMISLPFASDTMIGVFETIYKTQFAPVPMQNPAESCHFWGFVGNL